MAIMPETENRATDLCLTVSRRKFGNMIAVKMK